MVQSHFVAETYMLLARWQLVLVGLVVLRQLWQALRTAVLARNTGS